MSRKPLLTPTERENLLALPTDESELIRLTTFSEQDIQLINQHRGDASRFGFAIQLCYLRYPGRILEDGEELLVVSTSASYTLTLDYKLLQRR